MKNSKLFSIAKISIMSVIIALCAWVTVPFAVPFTLQTLGVYLALLLLGGRAGTAAIALYLLLGLAGLPVFSGFASGAGYIMGPTGGYLLGFLLCGLTYLAGEYFFKRTIYKVFLLILGTLLCYAAGTLWFVFFSSAAGSVQGFLQAAAVCVLPYVLPDGLKLLCAFYLAKKLTPVINHVNKD